MSTINLSIDRLIDSHEIVAVVDDSPEIVLLLNHYLQKLGLPSQSASSAQELHNLFTNYSIALVLLDIGLPDRNGIDVMHELSAAFPDLAIIIVTGTTDVEVALRCLREGADDYLIKPVNIDRFQRTVLSTLTKRRLSIDNKRFQKELEANAYKNQFLHQLSMMMTSAYLSTQELREILHAILVGITANEGLKFNRAILTLFDEKHQYLCGRLAIGPATPEEAGVLWKSIENKSHSLHDLITAHTANSLEIDKNLNQLIQTLNIPVTDGDHILIAATRLRTSQRVTGGISPMGTRLYGLDHLLNHDSFVAIPLYSPRKSIGVLIADNLVTKAPITAEDVQNLEIFASQASLAIEHCSLYEEMSRKVSELEKLTEELEHNRDLLVAAEKYTAAGQMSAHLVHSIRNPITAIGGIARLLTKKAHDESIAKYLDQIVFDSSKIEEMLDDMFAYIEQDNFHVHKQPVYPLLQKSVAFFYAKMKASGITCSFDFQGDDPLPAIDATKMSLAMYHLVKNAIEAMPEGGTLSIGGFSDEHSLTLRISDTGVGLSKENLSRASDPFFTTKTYGTGMGLTLVKDILHKLHGTLELLPGSPTGTTAIVHLPLTK